MIEENRTEENNDITNQTSGVVNNTASWDELFSEEESRSIDEHISEITEEDIERITDNRTTESEEVPVVESTTEETNLEESEEEDPPYRVVDLSRDELIDMFSFTLGTNDFTPVEVRQEADVVNNEIEESSEENTEEEESLEIPEISETNRIEEYRSRFSSAVWADRAKEIHITLAGVGGIGSWTGVLLSRLGINSMSIYDDDIVEEVNLSGQLFEGTHIGRHKVEALRTLMNRFSFFYNVNTFPRKYTEYSIATKVMICGFDNMVARKDFFASWYNLVVEASKNKEENLKEYLFIDGRLAAEELQIFCLRGDDLYSIHKYSKEHLFSDEEAEETVCSYRQTSFMAGMIGALINNLFVNYVANLEEDIIFERDLPFFTSYNAETMYFKTIH